MKLVEGVTMPYFPNYLSLASPFAFLGLNFFNTMEYQMRHMDRLFGELKKRGAATFEEMPDRYRQLPGEAASCPAFACNEEVSMTAWPV